MNGRPLARGLIPLVLALASACEQPPVVPTQDKRQQSSSSRIEGEVVVQGTARGNAVVLLYDAARPPPPAGTGRPLAFTFIPASRLYGASLEDRTFAGPFTAPYAFTLVPQGRYIIRGFIDHDECAGAGGSCRGPDFNPWYSVTAEPNRGDVGGAAVDAVTRQSRVIEILPTSESILAAATGVSVSFSDAATVPIDRPTFGLTGPVVYAPTPGMPNKTIDLFPTPIRDGPVDQRADVFYAKYYDDNRDGNPDGFWPKVVVRKLDDGSPSNLVDENDLDRNGVLDEADFKDYPHTDAGPDGKPDLVVLAAGFYTPPVQALLNDASGVPKRDPVTGDFAVVPVPSLRLVLQPAALDVSNPAAPPARLESLPPGRYAIVLISFTGQTWRVPNELQPATASQFGLPSFASQSYPIEVPAPP